MYAPVVRNSVSHLLVAVALLTCVASAQAEVDGANVLDSVLARYHAAVGAWARTITDAASWLFWTLATISLVWTGGMMALRRADIGEFFAELVRFLVFTGFFWWLLSNGPQFATSMYASLRTLGGQAAGLSGTLSPSGIVDIGFAIFGKVVDQSSFWSPGISVVGILIAAVILVVLALVGINMLLLLVTGWVLAFAGVFFLGFGGARWTSDMAIGYFKTVLNLSMQLFTMVLIVGIGKTFLDDYYSRMSADATLKEMGVILVAAIILLALANRVPSLIGGIAGGSAAAGGIGVGAGAVIAGAAMLGTGLAALGSAAISSGFAVAGSASALKAAFEKASAAEGAGGGGGVLSAPGGETADGMSSFGGGQTSTDATLAGAMGDSFGPGTGETVRTNGYMPTGEAESETEGGVGEVAGAGLDSNGEAGPRSGGSATRGQGEPDNAQTHRVSGHLSSDAHHEPRNSSSGKTARLAAGTATNLFKGAIDVASTKLNTLKGSASKRIAGTTGGKIAAVIRGEGANSRAGFDSAVGEFGEGLERMMDKDAEIAAFRDRHPPMERNGG